MASLTPAAVQNENLHIQRGKGVEGSEFGVTQNENLHILKGKAVDGAKSGIIQNENLHILKGKGVEGFKAEVPKPAKAGHQERKALRDLSQARKPVLPAANKATALKDKPTAAIRETAKKAPKSYILTDEEMSKCREWAKEGIEHVHFSGNDMQKFEARQQEERVRKKVDKAMSALREWTDMTFGLEIPVKEVPSDTEDTLQLKFEPEVLPPTPRARLPKKSGNEEICELLELDYDSIYFDRQIEIKLKEECEALGNGSVTPLDAECQYISKYSTRRSCEVKTKAILRDEQVQEESIESVVAEHLPVEEVAGIKQMFDMMDTNKNGNLTLKELKEGLQNIGSPVADPDVQMLMEAVTLAHNN